MESLIITIKQLNPRKSNKNINNDVQEWLTKFADLATNYSYSHDVLGDAFGHPIILFHPENYSTAKKNVLLASLFHGDEIAGMIALCELLDEGLLDMYQDLAISFIPIVNPTGFELDQRLNLLGENPNRGFDDSDTDVSVEGDILLKNSELLFQLAKDGFLSLHEDSDVKDGLYVYSYENDTKAPLGNACLNINKRIMQPLNGKIIINIGKGYREDIITDGLILNEFGDGTYEEMLFGDKICSIAVVTETPSHSDVPFRTRVELNKNYIRTFLDFVS